MDFENIDIVGIEITFTCLKASIPAAEMTIFIRNANVLICSFKNNQALSRD